MDTQRLPLAISFLLAIGCSSLQSQRATHAPAAHAKAAHAKGVVSLKPETGPRVTFKKCYRSIESVRQKPAQVRKAPPSVTRWYVFSWGDGEAVIGHGGGKLWSDKQQSIEPMIWDESESGKTLWSVISHYC